MQKFRKKPVVIEAVQWDGTKIMALSIISMMGSGGLSVYTHRDNVSSITIKTLEGDMIASPGDWIIRGISGEFYPCKPDIFEKTYEPA